MLTVDETTVIAISRACTCAYMHAYVRQNGCVRAYTRQNTHTTHTHAQAVDKVCYVCCHCRRQVVLTVDETTVIAISGPGQTFQVTQKIPGTSTQLQAR